MKVEVIPSIQIYDTPTYPEDSPEDWGRQKAKTRILDVSPHEKKVRFIFEELERETRASLQAPPRSSPIKEQEALHYALPNIWVILIAAMIGLLCLIVLLRRVTNNTIAR